MNIIDLATYRRTGKQVPPLRMVREDDVRVAFARQVEERAFQMEMEQMAMWLRASEGRLPARNCEDCRPSDTGGEA